MASYRDFEALVTEIQKQLAPGAEVVHDVRLPGRHTGVPRQIDVLVQQRIGQYDVKIVIDCKDHAQPVDVKGVEEFHGLLDDVGAQKGVLVCPAGFSQAAKARAEGWLIELYSPFDTGAHKWRVDPSISAICDLREATMSFGLVGSAPNRFCTDLEFYNHLVAYDEDGKQLGVPLAGAMERWNNGRFPTDVGRHEDLPIFEPASVLADNGYGRRIPLRMTVSLHVSRRLYFGRLPITKISGFVDEIRDNIIANAFTMGIIDPSSIEATWMRLASESEAPMQPAIVMRGLLGWVSE